MVGFHLTLKPINIEKSVKYKMFSLLNMNMPTLQLKILLPNPFYIKFVNIYVLFHVNNLYKHDITESLYGMLV